MYIIGRMNVNAIAFSLPPLSLSMTQRHDLWLVSVFQAHPSRAGCAVRAPVVNHSESLSLISISRSSVAPVPASPQPHTQTHTHTHTHTHTQLWTCNQHSETHTSDTHLPLTGAVGLG